VIAGQPGGLSILPVAPWPLADTLRARDTRTATPLVDLRVHRGQPRHPSRRMMGRRGIEAIRSVPPWRFQRLGRARSLVTGWPMFRISLESEPSHHRQSSSGQKRPREPGFGRDPRRLVGVAVTEGGRFAGRSPARRGWLILLEGLTAGHTMNPTPRAMTARRP